MGIDHCLCQFGWKGNTAILWSDAMVLHIMILWYVQGLEHATSLQSLQVLAHVTQDVLELTVDTNNIVW